MWYGVRKRERVRRGYSENVGVLLLLWFCCIVASGRQNLFRVSSSDQQRQPTSIEPVGIPVRNGKPTPSGRYTPSTGEPRRQGSPTIVNPETVSPPDVTLSTPQQDDEIEIDESAVGGEIIGQLQTWFEDGLKKQIGIQATAIEEDDLVNVGYVQANHIANDDGWGSRAFNTKPPQFDLNDETTLKKWEGVCEDAVIPKIDYCHRKALHVTATVCAWMQTQQNRDTLQEDASDASSLSDVKSKSKMAQYWFHYFGKYTEERFNEVRNAICKVLTGIVIRGVEYNCESKGQSPQALVNKQMCQDRDFTFLGTCMINAWAWKGDVDEWPELGEDGTTPRKRGQVYLCRWWTMNQMFSAGIGFGYRPRCAILLHELFHAFANSDDHDKMYYFLNIKKSDKFNFPQDRREQYASTNADSLSMWARDVYKHLRGPGAVHFKQVYNPTFSPQNVDPVVFPNTVGALKTDSLNIASKVVRAAESYAKAIEVWNTRDEATRLVDAYYAAYTIVGEKRNRGPLTVPFSGRHNPLAADIAGNMRGDAALDVMSMDMATVLQSCKSADDVYWNIFARIDGVVLKSDDPKIGMYEVRKRLLVQETITKRTALTALQGVEIGDGGGQQLMIDPPFDPTRACFPDTSDRNADLTTNVKKCVDVTDGATCATTTYTYFVQGGQIFTCRPYNLIYTESVDVMPSPTLALELTRVKQIGTLLQASVVVGDQGDGPISIDFAVGSEKALGSVPIDFSKMPSGENAFLTLKLPASGDGIVHSYHFRLLYDQTLRDTAFALANDAMGRSQPTKLLAQIASKYVKKAMTDAIEKVLHVVASDSGADANTPLTQSFIDGEKDIFGTIGREEEDEDYGLGEVDLALEEGPSMLTGNTLTGVLAEKGAPNEANGLINVL